MLVVSLATLYKAPDAKQVVDRNLSMLDSHMQLAADAILSPATERNTPCLRFFDHKSNHTDCCDHQIDVSADRAEKVERSTELAELWSKRQVLDRKLLHSQNISGLQEIVNVFKVRDDLIARRHQSSGHRPPEISSLRFRLPNLVLPLPPRNPDRYRYGARGRDRLCPSRPLTRRQARPRRSENPADLRLHPHSPDRSSMEPGNYP